MIYDTQITIVSTRFKNQLIMLRCPTFEFHGDILGKIGWQQLFLRDDVSCTKQRLKPISVYQLHGGSGKSSIISILEMKILYNFSIDMFNYQRVLHCYFLSASLGFASGKHAKTAAMGHISSPHCHEPSQEPTMRCQNKHHLYVRGINNNISIKEMVLRSLIP